MDFKLEICSFNLQSALLAQAVGANRIELCADPADGGTTPSYGTIKTAREKIHIELYPIIRPRGGDFLFNEEEYEIMKKDIALCKELGCDGVVIGMLNKDGSIDMRSAKLVELAYPLGVTFHRAFDAAVDPFGAMETIIGIGCERILTSGQRPTAIEGASLLKELVLKSDGRIIIMPGSGVRANNVLGLRLETGAAEFHTSARTLVKSQMQFENPNMVGDSSITMTDKNEIEKIIHLLSNN